MKINICPACNAQKHGIKSRIAFPHTCENIETDKRIYSQISKGIGWGKINSINNNLIQISELSPGDLFYFPNNKSDIFEMEGLIMGSNGKVKSCTARLTGKLYPTYFSLKHSIIKLKQHDASSVDRDRKTTI